MLRRPPQSRPSPRGAVSLSIIISAIVLLLLCGAALSTSAFFSFRQPGTGQNNNRQGGRHAQQEAAADAPVELDYYKVLQLEDRREDATMQDIRQQFRRLSRLYHPDVAKTAEDRAKYTDVNRAYEVLSDARKRKVYDMRGEEGLQLLARLDGGGGGGGGGNPFAQMFGLDPAQQLRGPDLHLNVHIDLQYFFTGGEVPLTLEKQMVCNRCKGRGAERGTPIVTCKYCGGRGAERRRIQLAPGFFQDIEQRCPHCNGAGSQPKSLCPVCHGHKVVRGDRHLVLEVEKGMPEGHQLKFEMEAEEHPDRLPGDLKLTLFASPHPRFSRRENNLDLDANLTLTMKQALLGFEKELLHLDGVERVVVSRPRGTISQQGDVIKISGKGMPKLHVPSERGDLYVHLNFVLPEYLTDEQRRLIENLF